MDVLSKVRRHSMGRVRPVERLITHHRASGTETACSTGQNDRNMVSGAGGATTCVQSSVARSDEMQSGDA